MSDKPGEDRADQGQGKTNENVEMRASHLVVLCDARGRLQSAFRINRW